MDKKKLDETIRATTQAGLDAEFELREIMREKASDFGLGQDDLDFILGEPSQFHPEMWFAKELENSQHREALAAAEPEGIALYFYILGASKGRDHTLAEQLEALDEDPKGNND